jgi:hypothetical protein
MAYYGGKGGMDVVCEYHDVDGGRHEWGVWMPRYWGANTQT